MGYLGFNVSGGLIHHTYWESHLPKTHSCVYVHVCEMLNVLA